jgi:hypothetical protein
MGTRPDPAGPFSVFRMAPAAEKLLIFWYNNRMKAGLDFQIAQNIKTSIFPNKKRDNKRRISPL